jgi:O-antigen ligase
MINLISVSIFFLAAGIFTSVSILSGYQVLIVIPMVYYGYLAVKNKQVKLPVSAWFLLAFAAVALLSCVLNYELMPNPAKNFGRVKYFLYGVAGIFVFRVWLKEASDKAKSILTYAFFLSVAVAAIYSMYYVTIASDGRAKGLTETMRYGYGSAMSMLLLLSAILHHEKFGKWFNWKLAIPVLLLGLIGMYLTYTRGALLGFMCGIPFVLYYYKPKLGLTLGGLIVTGVLGLGLFYLFGTSKYESRFLMNRNNGADHIRQSQWKAAVIAIKERPVLGWGLSNFHTQLKRIKYENDLDAKDYYDAHSHNLFLEVASGTGLIGLFLFLGWVISWALEAFKAKGLYRALIVPFGVVFVISSQFEVTFDAMNATMIFFLYSLSSASLFQSR